MFYLFPPPIEWQKLTPPMEWRYGPAPKTPHKCPVCSGNGLVPNGFYSQTSGQWSSTSTEPEQCRSCDGKGVIFSA